MEEGRCTFGRYWACTRYRRSPSIDLGLDSINLGCAWTSVTRGNRCNKSKGTKEQTLWANETEHRFFYL
jgi:hypothetical protein